MLHAKPLLAIVVGFLLLVVTADAQESSSNPTNQTNETQATEDKETMLKALVGSWKGTCRTWFRPGQLADESEVAGTFEWVLDNQILRHRYQGEIQGKPRSGEETIAYNHVQSEYQVSWFDDFHMSYGILFSEGKAQENGFSVKGQYAVGNGEPAWGWRTVYELTDPDHLVITAYNVLPDGQEAKAVETKYTREK